MFWDCARKAGLFISIVLMIGFILALLESLEINAVQPIESNDLGQGIYSLEINLNSESEVLKKSLVKFRQDHPNLRIVATPTSKQDGYGVIKEILIITEPK